MPRPRLEVADVFRRYGKQFLKQYGASLSSAQESVLDILAACRTSALGGHVDRCDSCDAVVISYDSCRNRHCPKCLAADSADWLEERRAELLPVGYYHVVFTLPGCLRRVALQNKRIVYDLLFRAAAETLTTVARNQAQLGALIGFLAILHTWGQNLLDHPHIHCVVPGGGISPDRQRWISCRPGFFLPVRVLSRLFRGKVLAFLRTAFDRGDLQFHGSIEPLRKPGNFAKLLDAVQSKEAVVYAKRPFGGPEQVLKYLARYTHRVAISNHRLIAIDDGKVTFRWKDYARGNRRRTMTLDACEFIRRFLLHTFPKRFVRIRSYGLLANRCKKSNLSLCREFLETTSSEDERRTDSPTDADHASAVQETAQQPPAEHRARCPICHKGSLLRVCSLAPFEIFPTSAMTPRPAPT